MWKKSLKESQTTLSAKPAICKPEEAILKMETLALEVITCTPPWNVWMGYRPPEAHCVLAVRRGLPSKLQSVKNASVDKANVEGVEQPQRGRALSRVFAPVTARNALDHKRSGAG